MTIKDQKPPEPVEDDPTAEMEERLLRRFVWAADDLDEEKNGRPTRA